MDDVVEVVAVPVDTGSDFVDLYRGQYGRLVRALELAGAGRSGAEDLAQEAFARTYRHWRRVRQGTNPSGYPYRVAFRLLSRDRRLARRRDTVVLDADAAVAGGGSTEELAAGRGDVHRALAQLPVKQRAAVVLCLCVGFTSDEAAGALGMKAAAVRKQIERARPLLRAALR